MPVTIAAHSVTVTGHGTASQTPDVFNLNLSVAATNPGSAAAYEDASQSMRQLQNVLGTLVPDVITRTTALNLNSITRRDPDGKPAATIYTCTSNLSIRIPVEHNAQEIIAALIANGGDNVRIHCLQPEITNSAAVLAQARALAWADAARRAADYAELSRRTLGAVLTIIENNHGDGMGLLPAQASFAAETALPIEAGETQLSTSVTITWELNWTEPN